MVKLRGRDGLMEHTDSLIRALDILASVLYPELILKLAIGVHYASHRRVEANLHRLSVRGKEDEVYEVGVRL